DGHVTTILTGVVLYIFGSGPVQGFATTLIVGLLLSLFSSIFIARLMFEWLLDHNKEITLGNKFTINALSNVHINFIGIRKIMYVASGTLISIGIISLIFRGLDPSVEFTGGRTYVVRFDRPVETANIRSALTNVFKDAPEVKTFGSDKQTKITTKYMIDNKSTKADSIVDKTLYEGLKPFFVNPVTYQQFSQHSDTKKVGELSSTKVDPVISNDLIWQSFMAVFFGLLIIFIYIAIRFKNWKYGLGGVISLFHDTMVVITMFTLFYGILPFSLEIDQQFIAALLTIIGYSIMDSVIIFDRIREYTRLYPKRDLETNINAAINSTLGRTINTSGVTLVVLIIIFIFGGEILRGFIFALLVGVAIGTYSSVFNATPIAYDLIKAGERKKARLAKALGKKN
ncbi:MAG: protein translocase subunit SecF, partial [Bacteroidota bacterium]|nr:protein translocase subunit SecF [Bacteroidota bacterium]